MSKGLKIIFGISLALNLLFIGLAGGMMYKFKKHSRHDGGRFIALTEKLLKDLPKERRTALLADFKAGQGSAVQKKRTGWKDVMDAVSVEPFDGNKVRELMAALHQERHGRKQALANKFITMMEKMTSEERIVMRNSRMFKKMLRWRRHRRGHHRDHK